MAENSLDILATLFSVTQLTDVQRFAYAQVRGVDAEALVRFAYRECKNSPMGATVLHDLARRAEVSDVPLSEWVSQIVCVYRWLDARQQEAAIRDVVEYVGCACEGSSLQAGHNIEWYLEQYGFERTK